MSSLPLEGWDFQNKTYTIPMPGNEDVQAASAPVKSDPVKEFRRRKSP
jgi:hypothetical protein